MTDAVQLALKLAADEPQTAAVALAAMPAADAAAFLGELPEELSPRILAQLPAPAAAAILEPLPVERIATWLADVEYPFKTHIARALRPDLLQRVLGAMSTRDARQIARDLDYAEDRVGAWMVAASSMLAEEETVADVLARMRRQRRRADATLVVVGARRQYVGLLNGSRLLSAAERQTVGALADRRVVPLTPDMLIPEAAARVEWNRYLSLPVVDRRGNLLGLLRGERLRTALAREEENMDENGGSLLGLLAEAALITNPGLTRVGTPPAGQDADTLKGRT